MTKHARTVVNRLRLVFGWQSIWISNRPRQIRVFFIYILPYSARMPEVPWFRPKPIFRPSFPIHETIFNITQLLRVNTRRLWKVDNRHWVRYVTAQEKIISWQRPRLSGNTTSLYRACCTTANTNEQKCECMLQKHELQTFRQTDWPSNRTCTFCPLTLLQQLCFPLQDQLGAVVATPTCKS